MQGLEIRYGWKKLLKEHCLSKFRLLTNPIHSFLFLPKYFTFCNLTWILSGKIIAKDSHPSSGENSVEAKLWYEYYFRAFRNLNIFELKLSQKWEEYDSVSDELRGERALTRTNLPLNVGYGQNQDYLSL